jgi:hypothetical protein
MKIRQVEILTIVLLIGLFGKATAETVNTIQFLNDSDNVLAASKIFSAFKANGDDVEKIFDETVLWNSKEAGKFLLIPKLLSSEKVDRVVVQRTYRTKSQYKNSVVVKDLVQQANRKFNVAIFSLDDDGDLKILGSVSFINDTLEIRLLKEYCTWLSFSSLTGLSLIDSNYLSYFE